MSDADMTALITNGKGKMPAFKGKLTDAQIQRCGGVHSNAEEVGKIRLEWGGGLREASPFLVVVAGVTPVQQQVAPSEYLTHAKKVTAQAFR